jgi:hypothetical protein
MGRSPQGDVTGHWPVSSRTLPASTISCRPVMHLAWLASCVTHKTARPARIRIAISDSTAATEAASRAAVGSSSSNTFGRMIRARTNASRSRSPVDRRAIGQLFASSGNPRFVRTAAAAVHSPKCWPTVCPPAALQKHGAEVVVYSYSAGSSSPGGPSGPRRQLMRGRRRNLVEMVDPGSIASGDLGLLRFSAVLQNLLDNLPAPGEGGLDMGII